MIMFQGRRQPVALAAITNPVRKVLEIGWSQSLQFKVIESDEGGNVVEMTDSQPAVISSYRNRIILLSAAKWTL